MYITIPLYEKLLMKHYTYSEARQNLAELLDSAKRDGKVRIKRRDGSEFELVPITQKGSVLDVKGIDIDISREEILSVIKEIRERDYGYRKKQSK